MDVGGSHFSVTAMKAISRVPVTNSGRAISASDVTEMTWSIGRSRLIPETTPSATEIGRSTINAATASTSDLPARAEMNDVTGTPFATDVPRSPRAVCEIHCQYCSGSGLSSPSCLR